ncbi:MAG: hypothetical protein HY957_00165 [Nitrospirae bacterium]|nr:hypothetical protein [Nitrospirota bacterium]
MSPSVYVILSLPKDGSTQGKLCRTIIGDSPFDKRSTEASDRLSLTLLTPKAQGVMVSLSNHGFRVKPGMTVMRLCYDRS